MKSYYYSTRESSRRGLNRGVNRLRNYLRSVEYPRSRRQRYPFAYCLSSSKLGLSLGVEQIAYVAITLGYVAVFSLIVL